MSADDIVVINDDTPKDSDIEVIDVTKETSTEPKTTNRNAAVVDDDIIEIIDVDVEKNSREIKDYLTTVCTDNRLIGELIEKCLDIENSSGMLRVIYRSFLPLYFKMNDQFKQSYDFKKVVNMTIRAIEVRPHLKFSHLKFVCEFMKSKGRDRKKVQLTTLSSNVTAKHAKPHKRKRRKRRARSPPKTSKKVRTDNVIEIEESSDGEHRHNEPQASDTSKTDDVVDLDDGNEVSNTSNKENTVVGQRKPPVQESLNVNTQIHNNTVNNNMESTPVPGASHTTLSNEMGIEPWKLLRIQQIEEQIAKHKKLVDALEQEEVKSDSIDSPYLRCERLKALIVILYKELCSLTGDEPVRKREIRFSATDGRPQLPLKILEQFINDNIESDGNPCLPDFFDVVKCVCEANESASLGWDKTRIWNEARALFQFCGHALQENRKKREWRYMWSLANSQFYDDPAEHDPVLLARLEENRRVAVKKEWDLLDQYVKMEEGRNDGQSISNDVHVSQDCSDEEIEQNNFPASTSDLNINAVISSTIMNHITSYRTEDVSMNSVNNMRYIPEGAIFNHGQAFLNYPVQVMPVKQSLNSFNGNVNKRMLEISVGDNHRTQIRVVPANNINYNESQRPHENDPTRMIDVSVESNQQPEVTLIDVNCKEIVNQESVDNVVGVYNTIPETFEGTFMDFVKTREDEISKIIYCSSSKDVSSISLNQNDPCNNMHSVTMPLVIREVYSVATQQIENVKSDSDNNNTNKSRLVNSAPVTSLQQSSSNMVGLSRVRENISILTKNIQQENPSINNNTNKTPEMSVMIKEVYSVAGKENETTFQGSKSVTAMEKDKPLDKQTEESETAKNKGNFTAPQNILTEDNTSPKTNEDNSVPIKTEISDLLVEMENFSGSFTATVFDVEDPFLVIEISDSSDESDDDQDQ